MSARAGTPDGLLGEILFMRFRSLIAFACLAGTLSAQSMPTYWRMADPDAKMLLGIDVKAVLNSPAAADWKTQLSKAAGGALPLEALAMAGPFTDILSQVDRVFISFGEIPEGVNGKQKMTAAIQGNFDLAVLRKFLVQQGGVKSVFRGVEIWQSGKAGDNVMIAFANPQTLAVGDKVSLRKAISQFAVGNASIMENDLFQRAAALGQNNDIWLAGAIPPPAPAKAGKQKDAGAALAQSMQAQFMKGLESFDLGMRFRKGLDVEVNLYADTAETAKGLSGALETLVQLASSQSQDPAASAFLSRVRMGTEGQQVQLAASWSTEDLAAMSQTAGKSLAGTKSLGGGPAVSLTASRTMPLGISEPAPPPAPVRPAAPRKVRIYNPDDTAVREFELKRD